MPENRSRLAALRCLDVERTAGAEGGERGTDQLVRGRHRAPAGVALRARAGRWFGQVRPQPQLDQRQPNSLGIDRSLDDRRGAEGIGLRRLEVERRAAIDGKDQRRPALQPTDGSAQPFPRGGVGKVDIDDHHRGLCERVA